MANKYDIKETFAAFFANDDDTDYSLCDCGAPHNRARYLYTTADGDQVYACAACAEKIDAESAEKVRKGNEYVAWATDFEAHCG